MTKPEKTPEQLEADRAFVEKIKTIRVNTQGPSTRVREFRNEESGIVKKTMDESGSVVTQHSKTDRQDVHINASTVTTVSGS
jgi:hypothetical protein